MVTVFLRRDAQVSDFVKRRHGHIGDASNSFLSIANVNNGNFSNLNLYCDNTVELTLNNNPSAPVISYDEVLQYNYIEILSIKLTQPSRTITVFGQITDMEYVNENNVKISYKVDPFSSAQASGMITKMEGLCERVNLDYKDTQSFVNLLPEPFSPSDIMRADEKTTRRLNIAVHSFEGIPTLSDAIISGYTAIIITVSPAIVQFLSGEVVRGLEPFNTAPNFEPRLINVTNFNFKGADSTYHSGGVFRGLPLYFDEMSDAQIFIKNILSGCGFRTVIPADGYDGDGTIRRPYQTPENAGGGNVYHTQENTDSIEMESIRFITSDDIYNMYVLPKNFCVNTMFTMTSNGHEIDTLPTLATFHGLRSEDNSKSKMLAYPYCYGKMITANGDTSNIIPQTFHRRGGVWDNTNTLLLDLKFIGGDTPKLMGRFVPAFSEPNPNSDNTVAEWFTIRNYPSIPLSINNSYNPQIQKDIMQTRKISAMHTNSVTSAQLKNPFKQGYLDGINGNNTNNENRSTFNNIASGFGNLLGNIDGGSATGFRLFSDQNAQNILNENKVMNSGNFISPNICNIEGNDFLTQYSVPAFTFYSCGASNGENFSFCRYLDMYGSACNCIINPLTNEGNIWGGLAHIITFNGKTFYQFSYIDIEGFLPISWKQSIKALFEGGVYLI